jgi:hypothetical protein
MKNVIPDHTLVYQKMKTCSFCGLTVGKEVIFLNYLSTLGYFVCEDLECENLSYNYKYFILIPTESIGIKEPFHIISNGDRDYGWFFSKIKKTSYLSQNRICVLIDKPNGETMEIYLSDLLSYSRQ